MYARCDEPVGSFVLCLRNILFFFAKVRNILLVRGLEASALHAYTRIQSVFMALLLAGAALLQATLSPTKLVLIRI
jgi:hypothetical protein